MVILIQENNEIYWIRNYLENDMLENITKIHKQYSEADKPSNGNERALNTFAIKVEQIDDESCRVLSINYADMVGKTSGAMNNFVNTKVFFKLLYKRIGKALNGDVIDT